MIEKEEERKAEIDWGNKEIQRKKEGDRKEEGKRRLCKRQILFR
jgi:hypothetical protein